MESESCPKKMKNELNSSGETTCLEKIRVLEAKDDELLKTVEVKVAIGPITPNPDRENVDALLDCISPLTWVSSTTGVACPDSSKTVETVGNDSAPQTPKEDVFDPFAPGPDELMLAPRVNKFWDEARRNVSRRLNFDFLDEMNEARDENVTSSSEEMKEVPHENITSCSVELKEVSAENDPTEVLLGEEMLLESIYESILDAIVSKQAEVVAEALQEETDACERPQTPTSLPFLTGIAETCPPAPMKPVASSRRSDTTICRKLEF